MKNQRDVEKEEIGSSFQRLKVDISTTSRSLVSNSGKSKDMSTLCTGMVSEAQRRSWLLLSLSIR